MSRSAISGASDAATPTVDPNVLLQKAETGTARPLRQMHKLVLALGPGAISVATTINYVVLAPVARDAGLSEAQVGGILTVSTLFYAATNPLWARASNHIGRKRVIAISILAAAAANLGFALALDAALAAMVTGTSSFFLLVAVRSCFALFSAGMMPASMAAMIEATTPGTRAAGLGLVTTAISAGYLVGPVGAAALAPWGALAPLWAVVFLLTAVGVLALLTLPSDNAGPARERPKPLRLLDARIRPYMLFLFLYFLMVVNIQSTMAWLVQDRYHLADVTVALQRTGIVFGAHASAMMIVQFGYLLRRKPDPRRMLALGLPMLALAHAAAALARPFWMLLSCFFMAGLGAALIVPGVYALGSSAVSRPEEGAAAAALSAAPPWALVVAPLAGALLYHQWPLAPLIVSSVVMALLWLTVLAFSRSVAWPPTEDRA